MSTNKSPYSGVPLDFPEESYDRGPVPARAPQQVIKLPAAHYSRAPTFQRRGFIAARLEVRHDPQTERWTVVLCSRTTKEDVVVAWKQTEADAAAWAANYGARS